MSDIQTSFSIPLSNTTDAPNLSGLRSIAAETEAAATAAGPDSKSSPFNFVISPHVAIGGQAALFMGLAFSTPLAMLSIGAAVIGLWPISLCTGAAMTALVIAMTYHRSSLRRYEQIYLHGGALVIERTAHTGRSRRTEIPALGLKLEATIDPDFGQLGIALHHRGRRFEIARDLSPAERPTLQAAFLGAMQQAGYFIPVTTRRLPAIGMSERRT
ncbi:DUF2244 domain-containing protein [Bradyrhizobium ontarionense]|uniref:DUF2244 domain-containing protein n=1 Tax=Bradyrhizobium ontarionense TaxID=2898149 RepID=A0ABY3R707_9BRAD|nr:DUF2244 domain-containing protein [Bradyrhizobium sp. A19]UFZ02729.1 DUF2244 domain-containing protein [Bradyrhizobium sp. A19]